MEVVDPEVEELEVPLELEQQELLIQVVVVAEQELLVHQVQVEKE
tara:strand:+ start:574 stop:708 length:135 start_codon:yes stop_codon:yes gene_type:complete